MSSTVLDEAILSIAQSPPTELGQTLPPFRDAISTTMATMKDVHDYEKEDPVAHAKLNIAYPRFLIHEDVEDLIEIAKEKLNCNYAIVLPNLGASFDCEKYINQKIQKKSFSKVELGKQGVVALELNKETYSLAKEFWQHSGEIVSSRLARQTMFEDNGYDIEYNEAEFFSEIDKELALLSLKNRISDIQAEEVAVDNIFLLPTGMAGIHLAYKALENIEELNKPDLNARYIQYGFPYTDTFKILSKFGSSSELIDINAQSIKDLTRLVKLGQVKAVFTEIPNNPLLQTPDLEGLSKVLRENKIPLIVDDTIGTSFNLNVYPYADIIITSLSKFFSGKGNAMGGSLIVNPMSPLVEDLLPAVENNHYDSCWVEDVNVLIDNSESFEERVKLINENTEKLVEFLKDHPKIKKVHYTKGSESEDFYNSIKTDKGGYGGLFSLEFEDEASAARFYDNLKVCKGPSFGTKFTFASPYTLLAHYNELAWVEKHGVSRNLVRVSIGNQLAFAELLERFKVALSYI